MGYEVGAKMTFEQIDCLLFEAFKPTGVRVENDGGMIGGLYRWEGLKATQWSPTQFWTDVEPLIVKMCAGATKETWFELGHELFYHADEHGEAAHKWQARFERMTNDDESKYSIGDSASEAAARAIVKHLVDTTK